MAPRRRARKLEGPVVVVHGNDRWSTKVSGRIAQRLKEGNLDALTGVVGDLTGENSSGVGGAIVVHASGVWWPDAMVDALQRLRDAGRVVAVGRSDSSRLPPALHGLPVLSLIPGSSFQPTATGGGGCDHIFDIFGRSRPSRPPTALFLSYASEDSDFLDETLVPLLVREAITYFDYKYTERLDETILLAELERWVVGSGVIVVVATPKWQQSECCAQELVLARKNGKPVVVVCPPGDAYRPGFGEGIPVISFDHGVDAADRLKSALRVAADLRAATT